jgi:hypothetical protein
MKIGDAEYFTLACGDPSPTATGLALRTVAIAAGNGELTITCIMESIWLWGVPGEKEEFGGLFDAFGVRFCSP